MKLKKIMLIIPQNTSGGAERVMCQLANNFADEGIDVVFVNFDSESSFYPISSKVKWVKMGLEFKSGNKWKKLLSAPFMEQKRYRFIKNLLMTEKPDVVLPFCEMAEVLTIPNCISAKIPFCVSVRNDYNEYGWYMKRLSRRTYPKSKLLVCQTKFVEADVRKAVNCKSTVIFNPLDKSSYVDTDGSQKRRKVIINVGRLTAQKNQKLLIESFHQIADEFPDYELHIFGKGELRQELEEQIQNLQLSDRVKLKGVIPNALAENHDAALFVMSSDFEGFPNTLVEAMANGIPVISTDFDTKAASELLKDGEYGYLVPTGNTDIMAETMRYVLKHYDKAEEKAQKALYVRDYLDAKTISRQWISEIEAALSS